MNVAKRIVCSSIQRRIRCQNIISRSIRTCNENFQRSLPDGPGLKEFITASSVSHSLGSDIVPNIPYIDNRVLNGMRRRVFIDLYGCQMNVNDTELVWAILQNNGFVKTTDVRNADIILIMTCAIRESAEIKIWNKLVHYKGLKRARYKNNKEPPLKIGILGCMAERLKHQLIEKEQAVDLVAGPDSYKDLPRLLALTENNQVAVNVLLSQDETYADIMPVRINKDSVSAFVSIMRGCDNMCTYCIVPFTRGRERSRPIDSILREIELLSEQGVKEVTLLGQNVNSYRDTSKGLGDDATSILAEGFKTVYKSKRGGVRFAELLAKVADVDPQMRIRFTSPHPKDFPDEVLQVLALKPNVCLNLHLPAQSGNNAVLERMRRGYTRESYLRLVEHVRTILPEVCLSSDFICGFCGETEEEFEDTLSLMKEVKYHTAYLFAYSMREKTAAHRRYKDDVPVDVKKKRLISMTEVFRKCAEELNKTSVGQVQQVLVEGISKRSNMDYFGRNDGNIKVIFPSGSVPESEGSETKRLIKFGDYISVKIEDSNSQVLKGTPLHHSSLPVF